MPTVKLTDRLIQSISPGSKRIEYWDAKMPGFGLRVAPSGRKTWILMYRTQGRLRRLSLGIYPSLFLADAREEAGDAQHAVAKGTDPAGVKQADRRAETFAELADDYLVRYAKRRKRTWRKDERAIERDLKPAFGHRKAKEIKRKDVARLLHSIVERGAPVQANRTLEILRKLYNWAIAEEIVEVNPCYMIEAPGEERQRERVLKDEEIRLVWAAIEPETPLMRAMFKLRLVTAQRGGEIAHMRKEDIDWNSGWWTIPGEYTKNGLSHRVPLNSVALNILQDIEETSADSPWVFPSPRGDNPITVIWKAAKRIRDRSGVEFVPHDLRRTAASRMTGDLGIGRLTVQKILNHAESGVTAVYDRHSYDAEKRNALEAWGRRLEEILGGNAKSNVVPLARAQE